MTSDELHDLFRKDVVDTARPYLWSDEEVYAYMNDAYYMFVRLVGGIPDYLSDVCQLTAAEGERNGEISQKILLVRTATLEDTGDEVKVINAQDVSTLSDIDYGILRHLNSTTTIGKVRYIVIGMQPGLVEWVAIPDRDYSVRLLVERLPLVDITDGGQELVDVPSHHHIHLLKWMRSLAYNKQDAETFNKIKAAEDAAAFTSYCDFVRREKDRAKHKVRVVRYGGI
jgi:hypothetical protein